MTTTQFESPYGITVKELKELMELKAQEFKQKLDDDFGGMEELANRLKTDLKTGLTGNDLEKRIRSFGRNEIPPKPPKSIFRLAFEALQDTTLIMLMICAVISIGLSFYHPPADNSDETIRLVSAETMNLEWVEGVAIAIAVIVVVSVSSFNDWRKERQFRGLQDRIAADNMANVIRNGQNVQVNVKDLVVGDVCCIKYGDLIQADGAIIQASDLKIDEASLTGETDLIKKSENNPVIFSGKLFYIFV
jgi:Ca2+ transporting ATPase